MESSEPLSRTVLIVEDAEPSAATLEIALLAIPGVAVRVVSRARQAIEMLENPDAQVHALVPDFHMPLMDGCELVGKVRLLGRYRSLPSGGIRGDSDPRTPERVFRLGANAYFTKPFSPAQVRRKVEQLLNANDSVRVP
ncbi:MAG: response regulator [Candidatus Solibacter usitatus]|nr:response regulator [Candidatus Solibacter usitatus]